jgi:pyridoxal phosphate-dependent aminotransferase EpsN
VSLSKSGFPEIQNMQRILLSVPHMCGREEAYSNEAFASNWVSTAGPGLAAFEAAFSARMGLPCVSLASGTAAIHLGLRLLGVGPGDQVFCSTLTFVASCNPIRYLGAEPVFVDSELSSWNMDPNLLCEALERRARIGHLPKAVVVVHLYGQTADMDPILEACRRFDIPVLEDAAEALGATYRGKPAGTFGQVAAWSFNGNKIITTAGGGMLGSHDPLLVEKARFWSVQAKDPGLAYEHSEVGYNYRMSNVLAGIGRGQLEVLDQRVDQRRAVASRYRAAFAELPGITPMPDAPWGRPTNWLSCFLIDGPEFGCSRDQLIRRLNEADIESRPVWKPMHLQPVFKGCESVGGSVAEDLFHRGICLPSSSSLTSIDQDRVIDCVRAASKTPVNQRAEVSVV